MAGGAVGQVVADSKKSTRSVNDAIITKNGDVIETHPDDNIYAFKQLPGGGQGSGGPISIQLINQSGTPMQAEATQSNGPDGRQILIMLRPAVQALVASGQLDEAAGQRWGVGYRGRSGA